MSWIFAQCILANCAWAQPSPQVLILPHGSDEVSYAAYLHSEQNVISFSKHLLDGWIAITEANKIRQKTMTLMEKLNSQPAPLLLKEIHQHLALAFTKNWPQQVRENLSRLWLTAFSLEPDGEKKRSLLMGLLRFHPDFKPSGSQFSPPILEVWKSETQRIQFLSWTIGGEWDGFRYLVINGRVVDLNVQRELLIPAQEIHLTALSNQYFPIDQIIKGAELIKWKPKKEVLVTGLCGQSTWNHRLDFKINYAAYFSDSCIEEREKVGVEPAFGLATLKPRPNPSSIQLEVPTRYSTMTESNSYWPWYLIGGLILGAVGIQRFNRNRNNQPQQQPTYRPPISHQGF